MKNIVKEHIINQSNEVNSGYILSVCESEFTGEDIVVILTTESSNRKTGDIAQVWFINPAQYTDKQDRLNKKRAVCGNCKHLGHTCYVPPMGTASVLRSYKAGNYIDLSYNYSAISDLLSKYIVRVGADGDIASLTDYRLQDLLLKSCKGELVYTHFWDDIPFLAGKIMASVDNLEEKQAANEFGFKTFRIILNESELCEDEILCPYTETNKIQCKTCLLCDGKKINIAVKGHGTKAIVKRLYKRGVK